MPRIGPRQVPDAIDARISRRFRHSQLLHGVPGARRRQEISKAPRRGGVDSKEHSLRGASGTFTGPQRNSAQTIAEILIVSPWRTQRSRLRDSAVPASNDRMRKLVSRWISIASRASRRAAALCANVSRPGVDDPVGQREGVAQSFERCQTTIRLLVSAGSFADADRIARRSASDFDVFQRRARRSKSLTVSASNE